MTSVICRLLMADDMPAAARIHRTSFDARLPWLAGLHTLEEDRAYWSGPLYEICVIYGAEINQSLAGVIAFREGWIDQLYVLPEKQGRGVGSLLLKRAQESQDELQLWTFQRNIPARLFYEARGFFAVEETDGQGNEEREPDVRYVWRRAS